MLFFFPPQSFRAVLVFIASGICYRLKLESLSSHLYEKAYAMDDIARRKSINL